MRINVAFSHSAENPTNREARRREYLSMAVAAENEAAKTDDLQIRARWDRLAECYRELAQMI